LNFIPTCDISAKLAELKSANFSQFAVEGFLNFVSNVLLLL